MNLSDFRYDLPSGAIAQEPLNPRDHSRLLVLERPSKAITHKHFFDLVKLLRPGDVLVTNSTKVFPARLRGRKASGGKVEVLLLESRSADRRSWRALVRGATQSTLLVFPENMTATMDKRLEDGEWLVNFSHDGLRSYLEQHGEMPLPPYIKRSTPRISDLDRYQTVYAEKEGAVAAPTAGFHFTPLLLEQIRAKEITVRSIVLHVGWGTFRPIRSERIEDHRMLSEAYEVSESLAHELTQARRTGRRIVAVGTTVVRTLESICGPEGDFHSGRGEATLFIYPGYRFKAVDALITNFHLPDSTPLLLACAFFGGDFSAPFTLKFAYDEAIREGYRFYSYGDAMLIQ
jgi:S-adenosylmethionine:tRNA ribosyltransferase-isomerase